MEYEYSIFFFKTKYIFNIQTYFALFKLSLQNNCYFYQIVKLHNLSQSRNFRKIDNKFKQ